MSQLITVWHNASFLTKYVVVTSTVGTSVTAFFPTTWETRWKDGSIVEINAGDSVTGSPEFIQNHRSRLHWMAQGALYGPVVPINCMAGCIVMGIEFLFEGGK